MLQMEISRAKGESPRHFSTIGSPGAITWMFSSNPPHSGPAPFRDPPAGAVVVAMSLESSRRRSPSQSRARSGTRRDVGPREGEGQGREK